MKVIYMRETLDLMPDKTVKSLVESGVVKQTEGGILYLLIDGD